MVTAANREMALRVACSKASRPYLGIRPEYYFDEAGPCSTIEIAAYLAPTLTSP
jgi:hypothetical protein